MSAHVCLDESRAAFCDDLADGTLETAVVYNVFDKRYARLRLLSNTAHDNQAMLREVRLLSKSNGGVHIGDNGMAEVGFLTREIARQFQFTLTINQ